MTSFDCFRNWTLQSLVLALWGAAWFATNCSLEGADVSPAMRKGTDPAWYKDGEVQFPKSMERDGFKERLGNVSTVKPKPPPVTSSWDWDWLTWPMIIATAVVVAILLFAFFAVRGSWFFHLRDHSEEKIQRRLRPAQLSDLPFQMETPLEGLLQEADAARLRGDFSRAIVLLFGHILFELDTARKIHLQRGKTNGMYLRELGGQRELREMVLRVVLTFELAFFGKYVITESQFYECWNLLPDFRKQLNSALSSSSDAVVPKATKLGSLAVPLHSEGS